MFEVHNLSAAYGQSEVLHAIDLSARAGEIVALVGRNGMGKSTLMKSLIGVMPARSGTDHGRRRGRGRATELPARCARPRLCAAGPADFRHHDGPGEYRDRARGHRQERDPAARSSTCSRLGRIRRPPRRQSLRRSAAAIGDCARARQQSEGAAARRADRRHPAVDHQGPGAAPARNPQASATSASWSASRC